MSREPLAAFEDDIIAAVASEHGLSVATLRDLLERHQQQMRDLPGTENLVYEWRKAFPWDVVVERREDAYVTVLAGVWPEFGDALGLNDAELAALVAVHERQLATDSDADIGDYDAVVVTRE